MLHIRNEFREAIHDTQRTKEEFMIKVEERFMGTQQQLQEIRRQQVIYIFCDCTIKFTSPYRFACFNKKGT
jgi:hypothetical protein